MLAVEGVTRARRASSLAGRECSCDKAIRKVARVASPISEAGAAMSASAITALTVTRKLFRFDQTVDVRLSSARVLAVRRLRPRSFRRRADRPGLASDRSLGRTLQLS